MRGIGRLVYEEIFESHGFIYHIGYGDDFPAVYIYKTSNCTFLRMLIYVCIHIMCVSFVPHYSYNKKPLIKFRMLLP